MQKYFYLNYFVVYVVPLIKVVCHILLLIVAVGLDRVTSPPLLLVGLRHSLLIYE